LRSSENSRRLENSPLLTWSHFSELLGIGDEMAGKVEQYAVNKGFAV
jgi:hypothetical protein